MTTVYKRLKALQITLPDVPVPVVAGYDAAFVPFVRTGNLVYLSGRLAKKDGKPWSGKVGEQITTLEGKQAARGIAIELLATLHSAFGDLDKIKRICLWFSTSCLSQSAVADSTALPYAAPMDNRERIMPALMLKRRAFADGLSKLGCAWWAKCAAQGIRKDAHRTEV
jgi:hypothetical protein